MFKRAFYKRSERASFRVNISHEKMADRILVHLRFEEGDASSKVLLVGIGNYFASTSIKAAPVPKQASDIISGGKRSLEVNVLPAMADDDLLLAWKPLKMNP